MLVSLPIYIDAIEVLEVSVTCILQLSGHVYISLETSKTTLRVQPLTLLVYKKYEVIFKEELGLGALPKYTDYDYRIELIEGAKLVF